MKLNRLSPLNQLYRYMSFLVNANSCEWIVLDRPIDIAVLRAAAVEVVKAHPVLNSVQVRRGTGFYWKELDDPIEVDIRYEKLLNRPDAAMHAHLVGNIWNEQLPLTRARPWRIHVTEAENGKTWLQIITTHVFTDGRSANVVARDLAAAYSAAQGKQRGITRAAAIVRDPFALFTRHLQPAERRRLQKAALLAIARDAVTPCTSLKTKNGARGATGVQFFDYGEATWERLHGGARGAGLSVHPLILSAVLRTIEQLNLQAGVMTPVLRVIDNFSLRRFAANPAAVADVYDVFAIPYTLDFSLKMADRALVAQVRGQLDEMKKGLVLRELFRQRFYMLSSILSPKKLATRLVTRFITRSNIICTNIGPVPEEFSAFGAAKVVDYFSFSQMFPPGELMFLFSTYRGRLRLVLLHDERRCQAAWVRNIGEHLFPEHLRRLIELYPPVGREKPEAVAIHN